MNLKRIGDLTALIAVCGLVFAGCASASITPSPVPSATSAPTAAVPSPAAAAPATAAAPTPAPTALAQSSPTAAAATIDGTYETSFTRADLAASPLLVDQGEINDGNWGDWTMTLDAGRVAYTQKNAVEASSSSGNYSVKADTLTLAFDLGANAGETFAYRWNLSGDTLTFERDDALGLPAPTPFLVTSWTRTTSASVTPSPDRAAAIPAALRYTWVGDTRRIADLGFPPVQSGLKLQNSRMDYFAAATGIPVLRSLASQVSPERITFELSKNDAGCHTGDAGTYEFALSPSGRALSLQVISEACPARLAAVSGNWIRTNCPNSQNWCLGDMDAGEHVSVVWTPLVAPADWHYDYGRVSFSVPDGWSNTEDDPGGFVLAKVGAPDGVAVFMFSDVLPHSQDPSCRGAVAPGVGRSASALVKWMTGLPGLATTKPVRATVGGLTGYMLDLAVRPSWTRTCSFSNGKPNVNLFTDSQHGEGLDWGIGGDGRMRLWLLDLPDGRALVIDIEALDKPSWDALVPEAMPIVHSFDFTPAPSR